MCKPFRSHGYLRAGCSIRCSFVCSSPGYLVSGDATCASFCGTYLVAAFKPAIRISRRLTGGRDGALVPWIAQPYFVIWLLSKAKSPRSTGIMLRASPAAGAQLPTRCPGLHYVHCSRHGRSNRIPTQYAERPLRTHCRLHGGWCLLESDGAGRTTSWQSFATPKLGLGRWWHYRLDGQSSLCVRNVSSAMKRPDSAVHQALGTAGSAAVFVAVRDGLGRRKNLQFESSVSEYEKVGRFTIILCR